MLKVSPEQRSVLRSKADELLKRINNEEKFEEVALNVSDDLSKIYDGDLGYFNSGQAVQEFEDALIKMKV